MDFYSRQAAARSQSRWLVLGFGLSLLGVAVALDLVLRQVVEALELRASERGMRIQMELAARLPDILGDHDELAQVFQNLVDNAIKYGRAGTGIAVTANNVSRPSHDAATGFASFVSVSVRDQGEGIAREHLPRLTERFYRVDPARSRVTGGTGLGLAIVKHVTAAHGGKITVTSKEGAGSTFTLRLPARAVKPGGPARPLPEPPPPPPAPGRSG